MTSVLSRLFTYAKATGADAIENFTTEALAGAIRSDPDPFVRALASLKVALSTPLLEVATQVKIEGGTLDLLLVPREGRPVAVEVKVRAGQSGDQLPRYLLWAEAFEQSKRPLIVILSANPITNDPRLPWLKWQQVWKEIANDSNNPCWTDLKTWLEEQRMADDSFEPITEGEAASLRGAHGLLRKAVKILIEPSARMNQVWAKSNWPSGEKEVIRQVTQRFRTWPNYTVTHQSNHRCGCGMGIYHEPSDEKAWLGVWIWAPPKRIGERDQIRRASQKLPSHWEPDASPWELLGAYHQLLEPEAATQWFIDRISELERAGMITVLDGMRRADDEDKEPPG